MSFLSRLKSWFGAGDDAEEARDETLEAEASKAAPPRDAQASEQKRKAEGKRAEASAAKEPFARLSRVGLADGPTVAEAIALLRQARGTVREAAAVAEVLAAITERAIPDPLRVACADILAARGDEREALRLLEGTTSTAGLLLAADLFAASGQLARAVGTIERVLARDLSEPGARERHRRWSAALGVTERASRRLDEATVVAPLASNTPFRLLREVARGGAGTIYEAEDDLLGRRIAFKVYHRRGGDRAVIERELMTLATLAGPGIVRVFDADPGEGWMTIEWIPRGSIRDLLRTGDLAPLVPIARWARPLARALARIHAAGFVHADIKPANVLLRQPHDPVLSDFGIARRIGAPAEGGSPGYVSPERLAGRASDPRDDVYGFGRVLEDVLHRLEIEQESAAPTVASPAQSERAAWNELTLACLGPDEGRPADGAELVRRLP